MADNYKIMSDYTNWFNALFDVARYSMVCFLGYITFTAGKRIYGDSFCSTYVSFCQVVTFWTFIVLDTMEFKSNYYYNFYDFFDNCYTHFNVALNTIAAGSATFYTDSSVG